MTSVPAADAAPKDVVHHASDSSIDVEHERSATVGAGASHHFNAAGAALPTSKVVSAVINHLRLEQLIGGYEAAARVSGEIEAVYAAAARLLGVDPDQIALFDSASTGLRVVLDALRPGVGTRIVASRSTYVSHALHLMTLKEERGIDLVIAPTDESRCVDLEALGAILDDGRPTILTVAHVPTSSGLVEPIAEIGALARKFGATYLLDATQSVGHLAIDVNEVGCHALVTTGRKFLRAPRGTAFGYVKRELTSALAPPAPDVRGSQWLSETRWDVALSARRFETWEANVAARLGLGAALEEINERGILATENWLVRTGDTVRESLREIPGVVIADPAGSRSAIVTFEIEGMPAARAVSLFAERHVRVVSVPATHGQWDLGDRGIAAVVRASPHVYNDEADISALLETTAQVARQGARK